MDSKKLLIYWNNRRPLDYIYRKKYKIGFNSEEHRSISQIDVYLDWLEEQMYKEAETKITEEIEKEEQFKKGIWLKESQLDEKATEELFNDIDLSKIPIEFE